MKKLIWYCLVTFMIPNLIYGQFGVSKVGTTGAQFLKIGVGARAIGMGGAFVAVADDASALYWNPAGISRLEKNEGISIHTKWLAGTSFDFAGVVTHIRKFGTLGANITSLSMTDMIVRTVEEPEGTGERFSAGNFALGLSYARNLTDRFSIGFNAKYVNQKIWHMSASSFAIDVGTLFTTQFNDMKIGMSISNFGSKMQYEGRDLMVYYDFDPNLYGDNDNIIANLYTSSWDLPLLFRVGIAMDLLKDYRHRLTMAIDAKHPNDNTESINLGLEYAFENWVALRIGYKSLFARDSEEGITLGAGLVYDLNETVSLKFDYAYADFGRLHNAQRLSLGIGF